jgi:hypothetical protein
MLFEPRRPADVERHRRNPAPAHPPGNPEDRAMQVQIQMQMHPRCPRKTAADLRCLCALGQAQRSTDAMGLRVRCLPGISKDADMVDGQWDVVPSATVRSTLEMPGSGRGLMDRARLGCCLCVNCERGLCSGRYGSALPRGSSSLVASPYCMVFASYSG